jgi:hypothetical protein
VTDFFPFENGLLKNIWLSRLAFNFYIILDAERSKAKSLMHTGGGMKQHLLRQIFGKLVNKNATKPKIGGPPPGSPLAIFPETLTPPLGILANLQAPPPGFSTRVHLLAKCRLTVYAIK